MSEAHITLYGDHAARFHEIQEALEDRQGIEVSNAQTVRWLMAKTDIQPR